MKGKFCSEYARTREGFFGKKVPQTAEIKGFRGPCGAHPVSPLRVKALKRVICRAKTRAEPAPGTYPGIPFMAKTGCWRSAFEAPASPIGHAIR